ncbi:MAG TPA: hypothetical protein V6D18_21210 [Thermosynechococcaceae cyanobacterium]
MSSPPSQNSEESTFEQELEAVERSLQDLKARHLQVQQDQAQQLQLQQRRDRARQELQHQQRPELKAELQQLQSQLDELEVNLESRLISWNSLREPFWQVIRLGGLGVIVGWLLAMTTFGPPKPAPVPPPNPKIYVP